MADINSILKQTKEALDKAISEKKISQEMIRNLSPAIIETLTPVLKEIADNARITKEELLDVLSQAKFNIPEITVPEASVKVQMPDIKVPEANVRVTVDEVKVPEIKTTGIEKTLREVFAKFKLPKPEVTVNVPPMKMGKMEWPEGNMPIEGLVTLKGIDRRNPLPVELRDSDGNPLKWPDVIGRDSGGGARVVQIGGIKDSAWGSILTPDGRLKTDGGAGAAGGGLTDAELRALHLDVQQLSGSEDSVVVNNTVIVNQLSGASWSVSVNDAFRTTVASALINSDDRIRVSLETGGSGLTDAELRATALQVLQFSGSIDSVFVTGYADSIVVFQARTTNPTAVSDGADVRPKTDDLGRIITRPIQVRDLIQTAYATLANGTETTLLAGAASTFHDLIYCMFANSSDAAVFVDIRAGTSNGVMATVHVPASSMSGFSPKVPIPQDVLANTWTVDMPDITGTTVYVSALFSKEV